MEESDDSPRWPLPEEVNLPVVQDDRGRICVIEQFRFEIRRVYYLFDIPPGEDRGSHAHRSLWQLLVAVSGSFTLQLFDGQENYSFRLENPSRGVIVPPGYWRTLRDFSHGAVCLVLASQEFEEEDYIRDLDQFVSWRFSRGVRFPAS